MMIDAAQKDCVAAFGWEIRVRFFTFEDDHIVEMALCDFGAQIGKFFLVDFGGEYFTGRTHYLRRGEGVSAVAGTDIGDDGSEFPVHQRGEALHFVRRIGIGALQ